MAHNLKDAVKLMSRMTLLRDGERESRDEEIKMDQAALDEASQRMVLVVEETYQQASQVLKSSGDSSAPVSRRVAALNIRESNELLAISQTRNITMVDYILGQLSSLHNGNRHVRSLLSHFKP
ncbi:hypothetical protein LTR95_006944 [Oleoguttula sp. CCFEE 5521]